MTTKIPSHWQLLDNGLYFDAAAGVLLAPIERLRPDPNQPRKHFGPDELAALKKDIEVWRARGRGVAATGFLQPILGRWEPGAHVNGKTRHDAIIEIVDGERRWRALHDKGRTPSTAWVPVVLDDMPAREARDAALRSSIHRANLLPIEEAHAFAAKMDEEGWKANKVAAFYQVQTSYVDNRLVLLEMDEDVLKMVGTRADTLTSARVINKVKSKGVRLALIQDAIGGASFASIRDRAEPFIGSDRKPTRAPQVLRIDAAVYLDNAISNAREVRDALTAKPMPKGFYRGTVEPRLKTLEKLIEEIRNPQ